jgi:ATP-dependent RNA helicase DeaD
MNTTLFTDLPLSDGIKNAIAKLGFTTPTEIQRKAIPLLVEKKKIDIHGQAQTGTGKTLAFGIPLLERVNLSKKEPQALIVAPTRELVVQIADSLNGLAKQLGIIVEPIYGGVSMDAQMRSLKRGAHIVVGTPGRLIDHLRRKTLQLKNLETLVLDEADIMLDMGFREEIDEIFKYCPSEKSIWLFSATVKTGISDLMNTHMSDTISVRVSKTSVGSSTTKQYYSIIPSKSRLNALLRFIDCASEFYGFIFCQTKLLTAEVADRLAAKGYRVGALHGDMSQAQRNQVIKKFRDHELSIVVATDVAARGIDVANLTHVVNFSFPEDYESYVHRVGRTGRAGKEGIAITFINKADIRTVRFVEKKFSITINPIDVPSNEEIIAGRLADAGNYLSNLAEHTAHRPFVEKIQALVTNMSQDEKDAALVALLYTKFLGSFDMQEIVQHSHHEDEMADTKEIFISVGLDDGIDREEVADFLIKEGNIHENDIKKLRVIRRRSFIHLPSAIAEQLVRKLRGKRFAGRRVMTGFAESNNR